MLPLVLLLTEANLVPNKRHGKKNLVNILSFNGSKVILILLIDIVVFYMGFTAIHIRGANFQRLVLGFLKNGESSSPSNGFENPLQILFSIFEDKR